VKGTQRVHLAVFAYAQQRNGHELIQWNNRWVSEADRYVWAVQGERAATINMPARPARAVRRLELRGAATRLQALMWWQVGQYITAEAKWAKWALLKARLTRASDASAAVFVYADAASGVAPAREAIEEFVRAHALDIDRMLVEATP
jgi:EpsI family protein